MCAHPQHTTVTTQHAVTACYATEIGSNQSPRTHHHAHTQNAKRTEHAQLTTQQPQPQRSTTATQTNTHKSTYHHPQTTTDASHRIKSRSTLKSYLISVSDFFFAYQAHAQRVPDCRHSCWHPCSHIISQPPQWPAASSGRSRWRRQRC